MRQAGQPSSTSGNQFDFLKFESIYGRENLQGMHPLSLSDKRFLFTSSFTIMHFVCLGMAFREILILILSPPVRAEQPEYSLKYSLVHSHGSCSLLTIPTKTKLFHTHLPLFSCCKRQDKNSNSSYCYHEFTMEKLSSSPMSRQRFACRQWCCERD